MKRQGLILLFLLLVTAASGAWAYLRLSRGAVHDAP